MIALTLFELIVLDYGHAPLLNKLKKYNSILVDTYLDQLFLYPIQKNMLIMSYFVEKIGGIFLLLDIPSIIILCICTSLSIKLLVDFLKAVQKDPYDNAMHPQLIATIGVCGTFLGITIGLMQFDSTNLQNSVPALLNGMKTAFITSIIGIVLSGSLKYKQKQLQEKYESFEDENAFSQENSIEDLLEILIKDQRENNTILKTTIQESLEKMTLSLVGDGESTLIGQMKMLRTDSKDNSNTLIIEFREFANKMAENNSKAFIEALNESMKDLNNHLQEQFGENFKQLNVAVGKLLEWQEEYKNTIIEVTENQKQIFEGINQAKNSLSVMANNSQAIEQGALKLSEIIQLCIVHQDKIIDLLGSLATVTEKANKTIPILEAMHHQSHEQIKTLMKSIADTSTSLMDTLEENSIETKKATINAMQSLDKKLNDFLLKIESVTNKNVESIETQIHAVSTATAKLEDEGLKLTKKLTDNLYAAQENLEKELQESLNGSLDILGQKLTLVSERFANDYSPLADKLNKVLDVLRKVQE